MSNGAYAIKDRCKELFDLHGEPTPEPGFGESEQHYHGRVLSCAQSFLPQGHPWADINLAKQPPGALRTIERHVVADRVEAFKAPVGPLREAREVCPRTGRVTSRFFGDPGECWEPFKGKVRRARLNLGEFTGKNSPQARAASARVAAEREAGAQALAAFRAGKLRGKL